MAIRALFIDDNGDVRFLLPKQIEKLRADVLTTASGPGNYLAAINYADNNKPYDVIILDYTMPPFTVGEVLTGLLKAHDAKFKDHKPIIFLASMWEHLDEIIRSDYANDPSMRDLLLSLPRVAKDADSIVAAINNVPTLEKTIPFLLNEPDTKEADEKNDGPIDLDAAEEACEKYHDGYISKAAFDAILLRMDPKEFRRPAVMVQISDENKIQCISGFPRGGYGPPCSGKAVFSEKAISNYPGEKVILFTNNGGPDTIRLLGGRKLPVGSGFVVIARDGGAEHLGDLAEKNDFDSNLMMNELFAEQRKIFLKLDERTLKQGDVTIAEGESIILDPRNFRLIKGPASIVKQDTKKRDALILYIRSDLGDMQKSLSFQVDNPKQCLLAGGSIGLKRTENGLTEEEARKCLIQAILTGSEDSYRRSGAYVEADMSETFKYAGPDEIRNVRLMDFKGDQTGRNPEERRKLRKALDLKKNDELRGFYHAASKHPGLYLAQIEGTLRAAKQNPGNDAVLRLIVPDIKEVKELKLAIDLIEAARINTGYKGKISLGIMVESRDGITNLPDLLEIAKEYDRAVYIGGSDMAAREHNIPRVGDEAIEEFIRNSPEHVNPLKCLTKKMRENMLAIRDNAGGNPIFFCGEQASADFDSAKWLQEQGITPCIRTSAEQLRDALIFNEWMQKKKNECMPKRENCRTGRPRTSTTSEAPSWN